MGGNEKQTKIEKTYEMNIKHFKEVVFIETSRMKQTVEETLT
jgi:hypothetical protein